MKSLNNYTILFMKAVVVFIIIIVAFAVQAQNGGFPVWPVATNNGTKLVNMQDGSILTSHANSTKETAAVPGFACGELVFYVKHTGAETTNQLEIFSKDGVKLLGAGVSAPNNIGLNASRSDAEIQVVPVPERQNEWYIIYNQTPLNNNGPYEPTYILISRISINCCALNDSSNVTVIYQDIPLLVDPKDPKSCRTYRSGKAVSKLINSNHHYLYLFQRNHQTGLASDFEIGSTFTIDRYKIDVNDVSFKDRSTQVIDNNWIWETTAIELKPDDESQLAVLVRKQGLTGNSTGCDSINNDGLSFKPYLYLFKTNQGTGVNPADIPTFQDRIDFTNLRINGLTSANSTIREYCGTTNNSFRYLQNFWRKILNFEYSPNGRYIYFVTGGYVLGGSNNLTYLGQVQVNPSENWIRLRCQQVNNYNTSTGIGYNNPGDKMIFNIESADNGNLYFVKSNSNQLFVLPDPNGLLPINSLNLLVPEEVDFSGLMNPGINVGTNSLNGCYFLPDQIDSYSNYLPNGQNPVITGIPLTPVTVGTPVTIAANQQTIVTWSVTPSASINPVNGNSTTFIAQQPGMYVICAQDSACCSRDTIVVIEGNPPTPCCDITSLTVGDPEAVSVSESGNYYGFNFNLPINAGPGLFEELRVSVVNFELEYTEPECRKCYNHFSYMGTFLLQNSPFTIGTLPRLSLPHYNTSAIPGTSPVQNGVREIIWKGIPSFIGSITPHFEILFPKPILPQCCNVTVKACVKLVFKDVNCDICEKYVCMEFNKHGLISDGVTARISVNNYGINDEGIKRTIAPDANNYGINDEGIKRTVAPDANNYGINDEGLKGTLCCCLGGEIYIELEPDEPDGPDMLKIANFSTDENGEFTFTVNKMVNLPDYGTFVFHIIPSAEFAARYGFTPKKQMVRKAYFKAKKGQKFTYKVCWEVEAGKAQNRGSFAVSGKSDA